ncbi:MAG: NAD-dependent dihydropyrimidine dehydrogenase subunit PreA [Bacteroidetes bacterium ADurb.Bin234]|nr:MAG: NAD-dependent dihydropyrimidine dehydrogenase subunit PreA [Bacteroidetes bacterium ADurb.Bin234]
MKEALDLSCKYMGLNLKSPLIIGSCGLTYSLEKIKKMEEYGVGAVVMKSVFEEQIISETSKSLDELDSDYVHSEAMGYIKNYTEMASYEKYTNFITEVKKKVNIPVIASINCISDGDWVNYAKRMQDAGADALELNISILPVDFEKSASDYEEKYIRIISHVKENISIPLAVKTSLYFSSLVKTLQTFSYAGADALVLFNRFYESDIDIDNMKIISAGIDKEGIGFQTVLRWISIMNSHVDCSLSATSGIISGKDIVKQLLAGADTVQVATVLYNKGLKHIQSMLDELKTWMLKHNYTSISDFQGKMSYKNVKDPEAYLRIQFMKYFAGIE